MIDTHCHLDAAEFNADRSAVLAAARAQGLQALVIPAVEVANFSAVQALAQDCFQQDLCVGYTLGIHPLYTPQAQEQDIERLQTAIAAALSDPHFLGIGEIGLDFFVPDLDPARQTWFYVEQLKLAQAFNLPVLLHVRRSQDALLKQLRRIPVRGIAHAFNGSDQQAAQFVELGFKLGFGGALTYSRALQIRRLAVNLPLSALVLETDAPDISPEWLAKQRNSPAELPRIAQCLADLRGLSLAELSVATTQNACIALPRLAALLNLNPSTCEPR